MSLSVKNKNISSKKDLDVPEKGTHIARVVALIDLGHQPSWEYQGETIKDSYKIRFTYELPNSKMKSDGRPHWVSEDINVNDFEGEGISSTMMLRIRAIDPNNDTQDGQDLTKLINKPCMLTISHNQKGYPKIKAASGIPQGMEVPELSNPSYVFDLEKPDLDRFDSFPEFLKDKIKSALNYKDSMLGKAIAERGDDLDI